MSEKWHKSAIDMMWCYVNKNHPHNNELHYHINCALDRAREDGYYKYIIGKYVGGIEPSDRIHELLGIMETHIKEIRGRLDDELSDRTIPADNEAKSGDE